MYIIYYSGPGGRAAQPRQDGGGRQHHDEGRSQHARHQPAVSGSLPSVRAPHRLPHAAACPAALGSPAGSGKVGRALHASADVCVRGLGLVSGVLAATRGNPRHSPPRDRCFPSVVSPALCVRATCERASARQRQHNRGSSGDSRASERAPAGSQARA